MTRMEVHLHITVEHLEIDEVGCLAEFIATFHIDVIHENVLIRADELEDARAFDGICCLLLVFSIFNPFSRCQAACDGSLDAIAVAFGLIEEMEDTILENYISIDAREFILRDEEGLRLAFKIGKFRISICIVYDVGAIAMLH